MHKAIEEFLDRATEGLRDDDELRRETRAELATHAEEKLRELTEAGTAEEEAVAQTLKAMGETVELAGELHDANRSRMSLRARVRLFLRFALVPVAILAALWAADWPGPLYGVRAFFAAADNTWDFEFLAPKGDFTEAERLVLFGDTTRTNMVEGQKAIWEAHPTNLVYFGNYFMQALADAQNITNLPPELIESARTLDPDNALYPYLAARRMLGTMWPSTTMDWGVAPGTTGPPTESWREDHDVDGAMLLLETEKSDEDAPPPPPRYVVLDRDRLDRAMALVEEGLGTATRRTYQMDMLKERFDILGPPERMFDMVQRISTGATVLLPSLVYQRDVLRASIAYGDLLLREGEPERAARFLGAWETMARHILEEKGILITVLVAGAMIEQGNVAVAAYRQAGMDEEADRMKARIAAAAGPVRDWKAARSNGNDSLEVAVMRSGGVLVSMLIPSLGESVPAGALDASRRLEYTVATEALVGAIILLLFAAMAGCLLVGLRWRFTGKGRAIPILLVPRWRDLARVLGLGVLLPGAVFLLVTRSLSFSGHAYSVRFAPHKLIAEFGLLALALCALPAWLSTRAVVKRCAEIGVPTKRLAARIGWWLVIIGAAGLVIAWCLPAGDVSPSAGLAVTAAVIGVLGVCAMALASFLQGLAGRNEHGLFLGTLHRSLIPMLAAAVVLLSLLSRPILYRSEADYIRQDTMLISNDVGFSSLEHQLTERLRGEMLAVLEGLRVNR